MRCTFFLYKIMGSLTFQITPFLLWKFWNHTGPFVWISFGEKQKRSFVCFCCLFSAYGMIYFCLSCLSQMELLDICRFPTLEQLPDEFNPLFPRVGRTYRWTPRGPLVTLTESAARLLELHLPISLSCYFLLLFLCVDFVPGIIFHSK